MGKKVWTIIDIINWSKEYFENNGVDSPRLTIELILSDVLNLSRIQLYTNFEKPLQDKELKAIRDAVKKRGKRTPLQYIIGKVDFYGLELIVNEHVLIPRPETEELVDYLVKKYPKDSKFEILDIGTGSGCISLSLANHFKNSTVYGIDVSNEALMVAKSNKEKYGLENLELYRKDILNDSINKKFDIIVSNPPYISSKEYEKLDEELFHEPEIALTDNSDGLKFYKKFVTIFDTNLSNSGEAIVEIGNNQANSIKDLFKASSLSLNVIKDISDNDRFITFAKC